MQEKAKQRAAQLLSDGEEDPSSPIDAASQENPDIATAGETNVGSVPLDEIVSEGRAKEAARLASQAQAAASAAGLFKNRTQCMMASATTKGRGRWKPTNTFVPLRYPMALSSVTRSNRAADVRRLAGGGEAPING